MVVGDFHASQQEERGKPLFSPRNKQGENMKANSVIYNNKQSIASSLFCLRPETALGLLRHYYANVIVMSALVA